MGVDAAAMDWRPSASLPVLRRRAGMLAAIRRFFEARGVLEVSTPVLIASGLADPHIESFPVPLPGGDSHYLQTSPEYAMKRLLAAGSGDIYQVCPAFRAGERGRRHNPEFTLLEWYRLGFDHHRLMDEVEALANRLLDVDRPARRLSYRDAFVQALGLDPLTATGADLARVARRSGPAPGTLAADQRDAWLDWLMSQVVAGGFDRDRLTLVYDYPASQCALARIQPGDPPTAARFELYWGDLELANGYHELSDSAEQAERFARERDRRRALGEVAAPSDPRLLAALAAGLPDCAGVAMGLDRLLMLLTGSDRIDSVLAFPWELA